MPAPMMRIDALWSGDDDGVIAEISEEAMAISNELCCVSAEFILSSREA